MTIYIDAEKFISDIKKRYCKPCKKEKREYNGIRCRACWVDDMLGEVADAPEADVKKVKHAHWHCVNEKDCEYMCDGKDGCGIFLSLVQGTPHDYDIKFCPCCGAKMDEKEKKR